MTPSYVKGSVRWIAVQNVDAQPAPPFALLTIAGTNSDGTLQVKRPTADSQDGLLVNGPGTIPPQGYGSAHAGSPCATAYEDNDPAPAVGDAWGSAANQWKLRQGKSGYRILGGGSDGVINVTKVTAATVPDCSFTVDGTVNLSDQMLGQGIKTVQALNFGQATSTPNATDMKMSWDGNSASRTVLLQGHDGNGASLSVKSDVVSQQHFTSRSSSTPPTLSAGVGAGTGPTLAIAGTDVCGTITVTTGTGPSGVQSRVVRVTPHAGFGGTCAPVISPGNNNAAALAVGAQVTAQNAGSIWDIISGNTALAASTAYVWNYHVLEYAP
jgi:hypothetical protein